jgi:hypothetical protein
MGIHDPNGGFNGKKSYILAIVQQATFDFRRAITTLIRLASCKHRLGKPSTCRSFHSPRETVVVFQIFWMFTPGYP